jgi:signal-transduction protein with cAMP-binding, CBS, and nucleotidyltransferase domain
MQDKKGDRAMLWRKRAWDVMRDDALTVSEDAAFFAVIEKLRAATKDAPDNDVVLVVDEHGALKGAAGIRDVMKVIEGFVLADEFVRAPEETDWDKVFARACGLSCGKLISEVMDKHPPMVEPTAPILVVLDKLVTTGSRWIVVVEGGRPLGVVLIGDVFREVSREMLQAS